MSLKKLNSKLSKNDGCATEIPMDKSADLAKWQPRYYKPQDKPNEFHKGFPSSGAWKSEFMKDELSKWEPKFLKKDIRSMEQKSEKLEKPYKSDAQRRWAHTESGKEALGGESKVHEWDEASKGKHLPERVNKDELAKWEPRFNKSLQAKWVQHPIDRDEEPHTAFSHRLGIKEKGGWKMPHEGTVITNAYEGGKPVPVPGGVRTDMRSLDLMSGKYHMHGPKGNLPKSEIAEIAKSDNHVLSHYKKMSEEERHNHHKILSDMLRMHTFPMARKGKKRLKKSAIKEPGSKPIDASQVTKDKEKPSSDKPIAKKPSTRKRN